MAKSPHSDETLPRRAIQSDGGPLFLMIGDEGRYINHPLPERGELSIGREPDNDIRIGHPSVSRHHARLCIGSTVEIEDLGSANGVRVQGKPLPPRGRAPVAVGEVIELGEVLLILRSAAPATRARRLWPHGYFEGRVEEQCARAERSGHEFAVLRLSVAADAPPGVIEESFAAALRATDVLALYAPHEFEILLVDTSPGEAEQVSRRLEQHLAQAGVRVRIGLALHPRDGSAPEQIIAHACDAVRGIAAAESPGEGQADGTTAAMRKLRQLAEQVAASDLSVLILGETGVGKEVLAETLHRLSPRAKGPFVRLHCAAFAESLLESELFGYEKGSFTGAHQAKPGLLESAHGGTVLLDEVGELPLTTQVKLLRVLEDKKVQRIGALTPRSIDVRFLAATNRELEAAVAQGRFRLDLYFRLNGVSLAVPPLRERSEEIETLARSFITQACTRTGRRNEPSLSREAIERLRTYSWPGNIRELRNTIERAVLLCGGGPITSEHFPMEKMGATLPLVLARPVTAPSASTAFDAGEQTLRSPRPPAIDAVGLHDQIDALERQRIVDALEQCAGNQTRAAKQLGISRNTLISRLVTYGIARPKNRE